MNPELLHTPVVVAPQVPLAPPVGEPETVEWDVQMESPPPRPSRTVVVKFEKVPCRPPRIVDDPEQ